MMNLLNEYELAFGVLPSEPESNQVLYVENHRNADLEAYITTNLREIKRTFKHFGLEFIYLPDYMDNMPEDELMDTASYYVPWLKPTDLDSLRDACKIAIEELYNKVHLKDDVPAVVNSKGRAFKVDVRPRDYYALFYQIAQAYSKNIRTTYLDLFEEELYAECALAEHDINEETAQHVNEDEFTRADQMYDELKKKHSAWWLEELFASQLRTDEVISRIVIDSPRRLLLPDYNNMEIRMTPATMAFYLLYLKHPEGIKFKELVNYKKELYKLYSYTTKSDDKERILSTVDRMVDQLNGSQDEHRSRIKEAIDKAFKNQMCERYAKKYYLEGKRAEPMKIEIASQQDKIDWTKADL